MHKSYNCDPFILDAKIWGALSNINCADEHIDCEGETEEEAFESIRDDLDCAKTWLYEALKVTQNI